ncbi:MAG: PD-(D/E)XK nuclease family protein [Nitrososphaerota archaeon]|nr:PD-(D/E)XK nuclease family protein [Nitrososphaerota archaeon]
MARPSDIRISAKNLGGLALPDFCPRCFWLGCHTDLPFGSPFPGIFSSIDAYTKHVVEGWFQREGRLPVWLSQVGDVRMILKVSSKTFRTDVDGVLLTGVPDAVVELVDGTLAILDYKTARFTETQDELFPMYRVQLNAYALISEATKLGRVSKLALIYFEPPKPDRMPAEAASNISGTGFVLPFTPYTLQVEKGLQEVHDLARRVREIWTQPHPPESAAGCGDCQALEAVQKLTEGQTRLR